MSFFLTGYNSMQPIFTYIFNIIFQNGDSKLVLPELICG